MLSPRFALRQRALWEKRLGAGVNGSRFDEGAEIRCRVQLCSETDGAKGVILLPPVDAGPGDRITFEGKIYLLASAEKMYGLHGRMSHIEGTLA